MNSVQEFSLIVMGQVTAISAAAVLLMLLSRHNAARRHTVGLLGLVVVLSGPLMTWFLPQTAWSRLSSEREARQGQLAFNPSASHPLEAELDDGAVEKALQPFLADRAITTPVVPKSATLSGHPATNSLSSRSPMLSWLRTLAGVGWLAGAVVLMLHWAWQHWRLRWLVRSLSLTSEADLRKCADVAADVRGALNLRCLPPIAVSDVVPLPIVLGMWRPMIVVPRELLQSEAATRLRDVLIHECAHIVRRDPWVNVAQRLAAVLWWWHPGVLWLNRLIARSREEVCDNFVLRHGDAPSYAQTLLELTERCSSRGRFVLALGLLGSRWTLEQRIIGLLTPGRNTMTQTKRRTVLLTAALFGLICLLVGGVRAVDETQPKKQSKTAAEAKAENAAEQNAEKDRNPASKQGTAGAIGGQQSEAGRRTIAGRIVDDQDKPVAGARLCWVVTHSLPGGVIVNGTSDEQGRFSMSIPEGAPPRTAERNDTLWILKVGKQLATVPVLSLVGDGQAAEFSVAVRLEPETDTSFIVVSSDQDQKPVAGVEVVPWNFRTHQGFALIPPPIRTILSATTNAEGRVKMPNVPRKGLHSVRATSKTFKTFGTQQLRLDGNPNLPAERTLELRATARIEGQLKADKSEWVRGVELGFSTAGEWTGTVWKSEGHALVTTDDQGRFAVPAIAAGTLTIHDRQPKDSPALLRLPDSMVVTAGNTTHLEIALEPPVLVGGTIRTLDTDKPIPRARISVRYGVGRQGQQVLSDDAGRYEARVLSGPVYAVVTDLSKEFHQYELSGLSSIEKVDVRGDATRFDLPPIRLAPTITLNGKVIDQDGRAVAKAMLFGVKEGRRFGSAATNEKGEFSVQFPKRITPDGYRVWLNNGEGPPLTPTIEQHDLNDSIILRVKILPTPAEK